MEDKNKKENRREIQKMKNSQCFSQNNIKWKN